MSPGYYVFMEALSVTRHLSYEDLEILYRSTKDGRLAARYLAILHLYEDHSTEEAGRAVHRTVQAVRLWVHRWNEGGPRALEERPRPGRTPYLTPEQQEELAKHVVTPPREGGHDFNVWYLKNIAGYVAEKYEKEYSVSGIHRLRKRNDLTYRVPRINPVGPKGVDQKKGRFRGI